MNIEGIGACLTEAEAARRLNISRWTLMRARMRGEISHFRYGRSNHARVAYSEAHLNDYLFNVAERRRNERALPQAA